MKKIIFKILAVILGILVIFITVNIFQFFEILTLNFLPLNTKEKIENISDLLSVSGLLLGTYFFSLIYKYFQGNEENKIYLKKFLLLTITIAIALFLTFSILIFKESIKSIDFSQEKNDLEELNQKNFFNTNVPTTEKNQLPTNTEYNITTKELESTIKNFLTLIDSKNYNDAYNYFSPEMRKKFILEDWSQGYANTLYHEIENINCQNNSCLVNLKAFNVSDNGIVKQGFTIYYSFSKDEVGKIKIVESKYIGEYKDNTANSDILKLEKECTEDIERDYNTYNSICGLNEECLIEWYSRKKYSGDKKNDIQKCIELRS